MISITEIKTEAELLELAKLANEIWHECFTEIITLGQIEYMVEKYQSYEAIKSQIAEQNYTYFAVRDDEDFCGYIGVRPDADENFFLSKLYLRKDKRGKGTARMMLEKVFEEGRKAGKSQVYLTVNKHNDQAINVYKKVGFEVIRTQKADIGNGFFMDDYVFGYKL